MQTEQRNLWVKQLPFIAKNSDPSGANCFIEFTN